MGINYVEIEKATSENMSSKRLVARTYSNVDGYTPPSSGFPYWTLYLKGTEALFLHVDEIATFKVVESEKKEEEKDGS